MNGGLASAAVRQSVAPAPASRSRPRPAPAREPPAAAAVVVGPVQVPGTRERMQASFGVDSAQPAAAVPVAAPALAGTPPPVEGAHDAGADREPRARRRGAGGRARLAADAGRASARAGPRAGRARARRRGRRRPRRTARAPPAATGPRPRWTGRAERPLAEVIVLDRRESSPRLRRPEPNPSPAALPPARRRRRPLRREPRRSPAALPSCPRGGNTGGGRSRARGRRSRSRALRPETAAPAEAQAPEAAPGVIRNPEDEPGFQAMKERTRIAGVRTKDHQPGVEGAATAQGASAPDPVKDVASQAAGEKAESMGEAEPGRVRPGRLQARRQGRHRGHGAAGLARGGGRVRELREGGPGGGDDPGARHGREGRLRARDQERRPRSRRTRPTRRRSRSGRWSTTRPARRCPTSAPPTRCPARARRSRSTSRPGRSRWTRSSSRRTSPRSSSRRGTSATSARRSTLARRCTSTPSPTRSRIARARRPCSPAGGRPPRASPPRSWRACTAPAAERSRASSR